MSDTAFPLGPKHHIDYPTDTKRSQIKEKGYYTETPYDQGRVAAQVKEHSLKMKYDPDYRDRYNKRDAWEENMEKRAMAGDLKMKRTKKDD